MGANESILATEITKPADASDIDFNDAEAAKSEVVRVRKLITDVGGDESGKLRASAFGIKSSRGSVWSSARRSSSRKKKIMPEFSKSFDPETTVSRQDDTIENSGPTVTEMIRHSAQVIRELREKLSTTQTQLSESKRHFEENAILLVSTQQSLENERDITKKISEEIDTLNTKLSKTQEANKILEMELTQLKKLKENTKISGLTSSTDIIQPQAEIVSIDQNKKIKQKDGEIEKKSKSVEPTSTFSQSLDSIETNNKSKQTIENTNESTSAKTGTNFKVGDKVEARPNGSIKFYPGVITAVSEDSSSPTYNIDYEDGDKEKNVKRLRVRREGERQKREIEVGTRVEARFGGGKALFDGTILKNNGDNSYEIKYDDGDVEKAVKRELIEDRCYPKSNSPSNTASSSSTTPSNASPKLESVDESQPLLKIPAIAGKDSFGNPIDQLGARVFSDKYYESRHFAELEANKMKLAAENAKTSFEKNEKAAARKFSQIKEKHRRAMDRYNQEATTEIVSCQLWNDFNVKSIDLHGLYISEAELWCNKFLDYWTNKDTILKQQEEIMKKNINKMNSSTNELISSSFHVEIISGIGHHSSENESKLRPAIVKILDKKIKYYKNLDDGMFGVFKYESVSGGGAFKIEIKLANKIEETKSLIEVQSLDSKPSNIDVPFKVGDKVEARPNGSIKFYPGVITAVSDDSSSPTYNIDYEDGDKEKNVKRLRVRREGERQKREIEVGTRVEARFGGGKALFDGTILKNNGDNSYEIKYDDGDVEKAVKRELIEDRCYPKSNSPSNAASSSSTTPSNTSQKLAANVAPSQVSPAASVDVLFKVGDKVEARPNGSIKFYPGVITAVSEDSSSPTYNIDYEDGDKEKNVKRLRVRREGERQKREIEVGTRVEARFGGGKALFDGTILKNNGDNSYEIKYDDGDVEKAVKRELIEDRCYPKSNSPSNAASSSSTTPSNTSQKLAANVAPSQVSPAASVDVLFKVGDKVEARPNGSIKFYPGVITAVSDDSSSPTYNIDYEDGDKEKNVKRLRVRREGERQKREIEVGTRVEARFGGGKALFDGTILKNNGDNSYEIKYDDGDVEKAVKRELIEDRCYPKSNSLSNAAFSSSTTPSNTSQKLAANVAPSQVSSTASIDVPFKVGDKVEARPNGSIKFYPGVITAVSEDSSSPTYNIDYEDGDKEKNVKRLRVRREGERQKREIEVGTRVEARFGGGKALFDGTILKNNGDNSYEIKYDDGDVEKAVKRELIEDRCYPKSNSPSNAASSSSVALGDTIKPKNAKEESILKIFKLFDRRNLNRWSLDNWDSFQIALGEPSFSNEGNDLNALCEMLNVQSNELGTDFKALVNYYELEAGDLNEDMKKLKIIDTNSSIPQQKKGIGVDVGNKKDHDEIITVKTDSISTPSLLQYRIGDHIEARYKGGPEFYPGKIKEIKSGATGKMLYDVVYDDGDHEEDLTILRIRKKGMRQKRELSINEQIEARFGGGQKLFSGVIIDVKDDGRTYAIKYEDGDLEEKVSRNLIVGQWR